MGLAQLAMFVQPPIPGKVKTRLAGVFGERGAAELYRAFVEDTLDLCARVQSAGPVEMALWSAGPLDRSVSEWANQLGVRVQLQPEGDLGTRLGAAFDEGLRSFQRVVIIGSDCPTLPIELIRTAFQALDEASLVLGPSNDGGYYAVGASDRIGPSFEGVRWSTAHALEDTINANPERQVAIIPPWYDIDDPEDLAVLRAHISVAPDAAPATTRYLRSLVGAHR